MRFPFVLAAAYALLTAVAGAQVTPPPLPHASAKPSHHASPRPKVTPLMTFSFSGGGKQGTSTMSGAGCGNAKTAAAAQQSVNPVTGVKSSTLVAVPIGGGNAVSSTTKAQQAEACAHGH
jgi:hypothetical protein